MRKALSIHICVLFAFLANMLGPICPIASSAEGEFRLPVPGVMVHLSPPIDPPMLKGIKVYPDNPFRFDFILDQGNSVQGPIKTEATRLIKYFLASLTIPEKDLWVNLSPYEKDRIIPQSFGLTEMGRDLLAQDYMLKQITASLIYPEDGTGKKFWNRVYEEAKKKFGTTNVPVNTFNKVWIVPEKAVVYENAQAGTAYVVESKLKVMLEQDYLSLQKHASVSSDLASVGADIVREIVIPELTKEVNEDKNFVQLRQVYSSLILAAWYKKKVKDSILAQVYDDQKKVAGVGYKNLPALNVEAIYQRYLQAFKKGVFNYIKEEIPQGLESKKQGLLPRKYFSGGFDLAMNANLDIQDARTHIPMLGQLSHSVVLTVTLFSYNADQAMFSEEKKLLTEGRNYLYFQPLSGQGGVSHNDISAIKKRSKVKEMVYHSDGIDAYVSSSVGEISTVQGILRNDIKEMLPSVIERALTYPGASADKLDSKRIVIIQKKEKSFLFDNPYKSGLIILSDLFVEFYEVLYAEDKEQAAALLRVVLETSIIQSFLGSKKPNWEEPVNLAKRNFNRLKELAGNNFGPLVKNLETHGIIRVEKIGNGGYYEAIVKESVVPFTQENATKYMPELMALEESNFAPERRLSADGLIASTNGKVYDHGNKHYDYGVILLYNDKVAGFLTSYIKEAEGVIVEDRINIAKEFQGHPSLPLVRLERLVQRQAVEKGIPDTQLYTAVDNISMNRYIKRTWRISAPSGVIRIDQHGKNQGAEYNIYRLKTGILLRNLNQTLAEATVFKFGAPSQYDPVLAEQLYAHSPIAQAVYHRAAKILFGDEDQTGPLLHPSTESMAFGNISAFVYNHALYEHFKAHAQDSMILPQMFFGFSISQLNALVAAGFFDFDEMLNLINRYLTMYRENVSFRKRIKIEDIRGNFKREELEKIIGKYKESGAVLDRYAGQRTISISIRPTEDHQDVLLLADIRSYFTRENIVARSLELIKPMASNTHTGDYNEIILPVLHEMLAKINRKSGDWGTVISTASRSAYYIQNMQQAKQEVINMFSPLEVEAAVQKLSKDRISRVITIGRDDSTSDLMRANYHMNFFEINGLDDIPKTVSKLNDEHLSQQEGKDMALIAHKEGGIDFNYDKMNLQVKTGSSIGALGDDNRSIKFHLDPAMLARFKNSSGFVPVIINIQPMTSLRKFLSL